MTVGAMILPPGLRHAIEDAIKASDPAWETFVDDNRETRAHGALPLAVKYVPVQRAATYATTPNAGFFIGSNDYTWGRGVYVTGVEESLSTAIYGRVGVVARFDPTDWRAFDAREPGNQELYLAWLHAQIDYPEAVLTVHTDHWLHHFRNLFREQFRIDVVLFRPDEVDVDAWYTQGDHTWMAVSDWTAVGTLKADYSDRFTDARLTILVEEEFLTDSPALTRSPLLAISGAAPIIAGFPGRVRTAYATGEIVRVPS